jgi:hypothetical protein
VLAVALAALFAVAVAGCGQDAEPAARAGVLSAQQAVETSSEEPVRVRGFLVVDPGAEARLCHGLAESYPPQCGEASLVVKGLRPLELRPLERAQGVAWSNDGVTLHGLVADGVLRVVAG